MESCQPIGFFDSGYGGLTVLREVIKDLPGYDFVYLGDNARNPYGSRSFDVIYQYTLEAVKRLFEMGCPLIILACNTASAKALRTIQQKDLPQIAPRRRVLGVIRPSVEYVSRHTRNGHVGILATSGTVVSQSYPIELQKYSSIKAITQQACPMWVSIVENNEIGSSGADYFIRKDIESLFSKDPDIDSLILGCTHYPLLIDSIRKFLPSGVQIVEQGKIVSDSLVDYLHRHPEIDKRCTRNGSLKYYTTESVELFNANAGRFMGMPVNAMNLKIES